jgi:hypothetical protein
MIFCCDFSRGLLFFDVENTESAGSFSPPESEAAAYHPTETGTGILVTDGVNVSFTAKGNPADGSWVTVIEPQWQSSSRTGDAVILEHRADNDNLVRLFWDGAAQTWVFLRKTDGIPHEARSSFQAFAAGTRIVLGITWDSTNAGGMKLYVNGEQESVCGDTAVLAQAPEQITLHNSDGSQQPDAVFDILAGWSRMLSADEMLRIADNPDALANRNVTVRWTGTLGTGDLLTIDSERRTAERFDRATGLRINALPGLDGEIPVLTPGRRRAATDHTQTVIYTRTAAAGMEVRYRRRYL